MEEKLYRLIDKTWVKLWSTSGVYCASIVLGFLEAGVQVTAADLGHSLTNIANMQIVAMYALLIASAVWSLMYLIIGYRLRHNQPATKFAELMTANTSDVLLGEIMGGVSWGENRTVLLPPNIVLGLKPKEVLIEKYDSQMYAFNESWAQGYKEYQKSEAAVSAVKADNNLPRYMVTKFKANYNKDNPKFVLNLQKTMWSQTSYVWETYRNDVQRRKTDIANQQSAKSGMMPNSFCLHLIIETGNGNVLITKVSRYKNNDYPTTKAVSIGEQIELVDVLDQKDFNDDFVSLWVKRAVREEFGLSEADYLEFFDADSIRVLGLTLEGDIVNYALPVTIKMKFSLNAFKGLVNKTIEEKEISGMEECRLEDIPLILVNDYADAEGARKEWHPSSFLRLLLFYMYKNGYKRTFRVVSRVKKGKKVHITK